MRYFFLIGLLSMFQATSAQCFSVETILADACGDPEGENEMVTLRVNEDLDINNLFFDWPNNNFLGWCPDANLTNSLNQTIISSCGLLIEPPGGQVPAGSKLLIVSSTNMLITANSFEGLSDTVYIIYQCAGNTSGHFSNLATSTRTLQVNYTGTCISAQSVSYLPTDLIGGDGAAIFYDEQGLPTYYNTGCNAPFVGLNASWNLPTKICNTLEPIDLNSFLSPNATQGGTWTGDVENGNFFNPLGKLGNYSITYTVEDLGSCLALADSTLSIEVVGPTFGSDTIIRCDSIFQFGFWITEDTLVEIPVANPNTFLCDSIVQRFYKINKNNYSLKDDSIKLYSGESYEIEIFGNGPFTYSSYTNFGDTCFSPCSESLITPTTEETYFFEITNSENLCTSQLSMLVQLYYFSEINLPNIFTPNGDGENDFFKVYGKDIKTFDLAIYTNWGERVYSSQNIKDTWNGRFKNKPLESGIYLLQLNALGKDGQRFEILEKIKLIR